MNTCSECKQTFTKYKNLRRHAVKFHASAVNNIAPQKRPRKSFQFTCVTCNNKQFSCKRSFKAHNKQHQEYSTQSVLEQHTKNNDKSKTLSNNNSKVKCWVKCALCEKEILNSEFKEHVYSEHDLQFVTKNLSFPSYEDFEVWKDTLEEQNLIRFFKSSGVKRLADGSEKLTFYCHRSGYYNPRGKGIRKVKIQGTKKINAFCPANIQLIKSNTNEYNVNYMETHMGHIQNELCHLTLTKGERESLAGKIAAKIPFDNILDEVRDSIYEEELKRIHLVTKQDLLNIEHAYNLGGHASRHKNDALSVEALVEEIRSCVLFYKPQDSVSETYPELKSEDFMLIIMNNVQSDMLKQFSGDCICIDGTHGLNSYGFELVTLMVIDDIRQGFPCAFLISNRTDHIALNVFFSTIKNILGTLTPRIFMSDMADSFFNAWVLSMNVPEKRLFCSWHVDHAWRKNLSKVKSKEKQLEVYHVLRTLLHETDIVTFEVLTQEALKQFLNDPDTYAFGLYFSDNYLKNVENWAYCHRLHCGINTNMHMENMHRAIKYIYLHGKNCKRLDKGINTLMNFLKNKLFDRLITLHKGKLCSKIKYLRARHAKSLKLNITSVINSDGVGWYVASSKNALEQYLVQRNNENCTCKVLCTDCDCCIHKYICSCIDNCIKWNMCKHIHLVCRFIKLNNDQDPPLENLLDTESSNNGNFETSSPNLTIHIAENTTAMEESKSIVNHLSKKKTIESLEIQRQNMIHEFSQCVNSAETQEAIDVIKNITSAIKPRLMVAQVIHKKTQEFLVKTPSTTNKNIVPQRRLFSTNKKRKSEKTITKPMTEEVQNIALSLVLSNKCQAKE